jgi:hypothetical protein
MEFDVLFIIKGTALREILVSFYIVQLYPKLQNKNKYVVYVTVNVELIKRNLGY